MGNLLSRLTSGKRSHPPLSMDQWAQYFTFGGTAYPFGVGFTIPSIGEDPAETASSLDNYLHGLFKVNPAIFTCAAIRTSVFSSARFTYQEMSDGRPSKLFAEPSLSMLERPWPGGTTQNLLARMELDDNLAGNSFWTVVDGRLMWMRPDWVDILLAKHRIGFSRKAYVYWPGGDRNGDPEILLPDEVAHFAPQPDPDAQFRGMSWITPVIREAQTDNRLTSYKHTFLDNAATPNLAVSLNEAIGPDKFKTFVDMFKEKHQGPTKAGETLFLGGGADVTVVGTDLDKLDVKAVAGVSETRIAAASGVGAVVAQFSEGMQGSSLNAGNYGQARRRFAEGLMHPLWSEAAGSMETLRPPPDLQSQRLWYDARDVPFLREDAKDAADIQQTKGQTIARLTDAGFTPESAIDAVQSEDLSLLEHTGLFSVQLQPPNSSDETNASTITDPARAAELIERGWTAV